MEQKTINTDIAKQQDLLEILDARKKYKTVADRNKESLSFLSPCLYFALHPHYDKWLAQTTSLLSRTWDEMYRIPPTSSRIFRPHAMFWHEDMSMVPWGDPCRVHEISRQSDVDGFVSFHSLYESREPRKKIMSIHLLPINFLAQKCTVYLNARHRCVESVLIKKKEFKRSRFQKKVMWDGAQNRVLCLSLQLKHFSSGILGLTRHAHFCNHTQVWGRKVCWKSVDTLSTLLAREAYRRQATESNFCPLDTSRKRGPLKWVCPCEITDHTHVWSSLVMLCCYSLFYCTRTPRCTGQNWTAKWRWMRYLPTFFSCWKRRSGFLLVLSLYYI